MANSMTFNAETEEHTPSLKQAKEEHAFASFNFFYNSQILMPTLFNSARHRQLFFKYLRTAGSMCVSWQKYSNLPRGRWKTRTVRWLLLMGEVAGAVAGWLKW